MHIHEPPIAMPPAIQEAILNGAEIVYSLSGGKDSSAAAFATQSALDALAHPKSRRHAIHADLGQIEWRQTPRFVEQTARRIDVPLTIVRRNQGGLIERWHQRWEGSKARYAALEIYQLISPFSSASLRFCTSETKVAPIGSHLKKAHKGKTIISIVGIRRQESAARAKAPVHREDTRFAPPGNRAGTRMLTWHPIIDWTEHDVYQAHAAREFPLHPAYVRWNSSRLSCAYCVLAAKADLEAASSCPSNTRTFRELVELEILSGFSFQPNRWLADTSPHLLSPDQTERLPEAQAFARLRKTSEATLPADLRFKRGWPPRVPNLAEAQIIAATRGRILERLALPNTFPTAADVIDRFHHLRILNAA